MGWWAGVNHRVSAGVWVCVYIHVFPHVCASTRAYICNALHACVRACACVRFCASPPPSPLPPTPQGRQGDLSPHEQEVLLAHYAMRHVGGHRGGNGANVVEHMLRRGDVEGYRSMVFSSRQQD